MTRSPVKKKKAMSSSTEITACYPEPVHFTDDEPLPATSSDSVSALQKVTIKTIPERPTVASSELVSNFTVLVGLKAPSLSDDAITYQRAPIDLVTVLDVSGSMYGHKLDLVKRAVHFIIDNLGPSDRLSIVCFATEAQRIFPLRRMTENGRLEAKRAVNSLQVLDTTNIVQGLKKGVRVLDERRQKNSVSSIIFLSDGMDTCNSRSYVPRTKRQPPGYLHLLPACIFPSNKGPGDMDLAETIPVHSFGFGSDHDPAVMHAIADASGGTFSFIEAYQMVQDAFASCIGGLLSVVTQDLRLAVRSASHGVEIKSISSGRYASVIFNQESEGLINIGDLYADEEKEFLINLSVPALPNENVNERKTSLLDITCSYMDVVSKENVKIEGDLVEIKRPDTVSPGDMVVNLEVDRQKNRIYVAESIAQAQQMAEAGDVTGARALLAERRSVVMGSASAQAGDDLCLWLENDMKQLEKRFGNMRLYETAGRAYALAGMSAHAMQRATTRGDEEEEDCADFDADGMGGGLISCQAGGVAARGRSVLSARHSTGGAAPRMGLLQAARLSSARGGAARAFVTPNMVNMVKKSRQVSKNLAGASKK